MSAIVYGDDLFVVPPRCNLSHAHERPGFWNTRIQAVAGPYKTQRANRSGQAARRNTCASNKPKRVTTRAYCPSGVRDATKPWREMVVQRDQRSCGDNRSIARGRGASRHAGIVTDGSLVGTADGRPGGYLRGRQER